MANLHEAHAAIDSGLRTFFNAIFTRMFMGLLLTAAVAFAVPMLFPHFLVLAGPAFYVWIGAFVVEILLIMFLSSRVLAGNMASGTAYMLFLLYAALNGITLAPLLHMYTSESVATVFLMSACVFGSAALYGSVTKKDLKPLGTFFFMAVVGLLLVMVVNLFLGSSLLSLGISAFAVLLFAGITAWDMQNLREFYYREAEGNPERAAQLGVFGALSLYINFINIFIHLLRLFGGQRN